MSQRWPLTGRAEELRFIEAPARDQGPGAGVVLAGAAGVGKTRLAREALGAAGRRGIRTRWVTATASARALPLGAFAGLVDDAGPNPSRTLRHATDVLLDGTGPRGMIIAVDDAHLLDDLSAVLVHQLALQRRARVVLTIRSGETAPDAVTALWKDRHLPRLEVRPLSTEDTTTLLEAALGGPLDTASGRRLWRITQGNALYLRQLVDGELAAGRLSETAGVWGWSGDPQLSAGLSDLIRERMGRLSGEVAAVVEMLAFGEPLGVALLGELTDPAAVEQAEARGLIEVTTDGRRLEARLAHPLFGEVARAGCGLVRARRVRARLATALAATGARRSRDTLRRAVLSLDSDLPPDARLLTRAAHHAAALHAGALTERLARAAVAAGGGFEPAFTLASILVYAAATPAAAEVAALTEVARTDTERVRAAVLQVTGLAWMAAEPERAAAVLDEATAAVRDGDARLELVTLRVLLDACTGHAAATATVLPALLGTARLPVQATVYACWAGIITLGVLGRTDEIGPLVDRGIAAAAGSAEATPLLQPMLAWQAYMLRLAGHLPEAGAAAARSTALFADEAGPEVLGAVTRAAAELGVGQVGTALRLLREARAALVPFGRTVGGWVFACQLDLTRALALIGDRAAAREALAELETVQHPGFSVLTPETALARAWVAAAEGSLTQAVAHAHDAARIAATAGQVAHEVLALQTAVRFGDPTPAARLAELACLVDGPRAPAAAAHAAALAAGDGEALLAASAQLERMGDLLSAADAAAQGATAHTRRGRRGPAQAAAARADRLARACDGARTPALVAAAAPLPLSVREREILTLAVGGMPNREIAERLVVSVRTIEGHRYRACIKLGTSDLTEIAALLGGT